MRSKEEGCQEKVNQEGWRKEEGRWKEKISQEDSQEVIAQLGLSDFYFYSLNKFTSKLLALLIV